MKRQTETNTQGEKTSRLNSLRPIPYFMAIIAVVVASMLSYSLTLCQREWDSGSGTSQYHYPGFWNIYDPDGGGYSWNDAQ